MYTLVPPRTRAQGTGIDVTQVRPLICYRLANAATKNDDLEAAIAQVGIEVYSAMDAAVQ